ncbi:phage tail protein [Streptomyces sp. NPDC020298]|uniref:phage tail protein n=1 Tax=unclassified Streptomyces TaxID=2593676 RepID=UPI003404FF42
MSDYLPPVVIEVEGREQKLTEALTRAKAQVRAFVAEVGRLNATIEVDAKLKSGALAEIRRRVTESPAAKLKVDLQLATGQRDQIRAQLEERPIQATVRPTMDQAALRRVQTVLRELGKRIDVSIRPQMDQGSQRRVQTRLDRLSQNRTVTIRTRVIGDANRLPGSGGGGGEGGGGALGTLMTLAPALAPIVAQATAVAGAVGAATVAVGAFGLAVKSQLSALSGLTDAQGKYDAAVAKYGSGSKQAAQAQQELSQTMEAMPAQTLKAAAAFSSLHSDFGKWSNGLAKFTMKPVTQGVEVLDAILPKLSPLVKDTSVQFTRLTTMLAGGVNSGAFDGLMSRFTNFTNGVLKGAVDGVVHFVRVLSQGAGSNSLAQFMAYAKANAPLVKDTLKNLAEAIQNILKAASQAGPGMLTLVNAFAKLVASIPAELLTRMMQLYTAFKLIKMGASGITSVTEGIQSLVAKFRELQVASATGAGALGRIRAAFASLSTAAKASVIVAGIAAVVAVLAKLSDSGKKAPDVDKMTTAIGNLGATGRVTGEALRVFGSNLDGFTYAVDRVAGKASGMDKFNDFMNKVFTLGMKKSNSMVDAEKDIDSLDKSLANLVKGGHAKVAAQAVADLQKAYAKKGGDPKKLASELDDYKSALADSALEQKLTAESMGLFGAAAAKASDQLAKQKASADGLRQSIQALNDVNRAGLGGMIAFNQSIADAAKAAKDNAGALSMTHGQLNLNSQKARDAASALQDLADKTDSAASSARDAGSSWETVNGIYAKGRSGLIKYAEQMGLSSTQAKALADQILRIPGKTARVQMNTEDATRDLNAFNAKVRASPGAKSVTLKTLSGAAEQVLEAFGYHVTHLKNGSVKITAIAGGALSQIHNVQGAVNALHGKTIGIGVYTTKYMRTVQQGGVHSGPQLPGMPGAARGGLMPRYADGGDVQIAPTGLVRGPGTGTSDSIMALFESGARGMISHTEFVVNAKATQKYLPLLQLINKDKLGHFARGGLTSAEKDARKQLHGEFGISYFGRRAGYRRTPFEHGLAVPTDVNALVSALNGVSGEIKKAFRGHTETSLLRQLNRAGKSLISYDKQLTKVTASLASAKSKLDDLKNSAAQLKSSVSSSIMQDSGIVTQAPQEGFALSSQDVVNNMATQASKTLTFSNQLQALKKRGLRADLLEQIASAGVDQGGATAQALMGASAAQIKHLNSMQSQMKKSADKAGSAVADSMYGAGIRAAEGLVRGLEKKQKAIERQMLKIAKGMERAIKHALGIKSPSTVMAQVGDFTALGFAHGIDRSSKHAIIAARGMAMSVQQGATLASTPVWSGNPRAGGRASGTVIHQHFEFHIAGNAVTVDRLAKDIEQAFLRRGMRNPATYPSYKR